MAWTQIKTDATGRVRLRVRAQEVSPGLVLVHTSALLRLAPDQSDATAQNDGEGFWHRQDSFDYVKGAVVGNVIVPA